MLLVATQGVMCYPLTYREELNMFDYALRRQIGERAKQRREELNLPLQYVADQMGVNKSTVHRYEIGAIDNTKKLVLEGLSKTLSVTPEWLLGKSEALDSEVTDALEIKIRDSFSRIQSAFPPRMSEREASFVKSLLLFLLESYEEAMTGFENASKRYSGDADFGSIPQEIGFDSSDEFKETMYLREIMPMVNNLKDAGDTISMFPGQPDQAAARLKHMIKLLPAETGKEGD